MTSFDCNIQSSSVNFRERKTTPACLDVMASGLKKYQQGLKFIGPQARAKHCGTPAGRAFKKFKFFMVNFPLNGPDRNPEHRLASQSTGMKPLKTPAGKVLEIVYKHFIKACEILGKIVLKLPVYFQRHLRPHRVTIQIGHFLGVSCDE